MKVLLINPSLQKIKKSPIVDNLFFNSPPLGICYIASVLEKANISVKIIDAAVERLSAQDTIKRICEFDPDVVGITSTTFSFMSAIELAQCIKKSNSNIITVLGGPHICSDPKQAMSNSCFDVGVIGEGEITFKEFINALISKMTFSNINGLVYRDDNRLVFTDKREAINNLDILPFPARHLLKLDLYEPQPNDERARPKISMIASRGCPYQCIFCDKSVFGSTYRSFSAEYIVSEMEHLVKEYGAKDIAFIDSLFTVNEQRVQDIANQILKKGLKVSWTCTIRANTIKSEEILKLMKTAGCWRVRLGIESGNDEILSFIKKNVTKEQIRNVARWAHKTGLQPKGFFIVGHLKDTNKTIEETIAFAKELPLKDVTVQINTPLPNTEQHNLCQNYGTLTTDKLSEYSFWDVVFKPKEVESDYLDKAVNKFYRSFYLRPVIFWRHLSKIRSISDIKRYMKAISLMCYLFLGRKGD